MWFMRVRVKPGQLQPNIDKVCRFVFGPNLVWTTYVDLAPNNGTTVGHNIWKSETYS